MIADGHPGFESSVDKLVLADAEQLVGAAGLDVLGADAALRIGPFQHAYLYGRAASVYGGSAQIQRTIIAERILGLPRSH
jgi:alkylation response protein AidB-like acyl-CoA dehydrogenase